MELPAIHRRRRRRLDYLHDDGPLPDLISGLMWLSAAGTGAVALALPGTDRMHLGWALTLVGFAAAWGVISLFLGIRSKTMSITVRAAVTAAMMPVVSLALWASGGADSFLQPVLLFTALFIAYFFPPALAWPLGALFVAAYATPLIYDGSALNAAYPARVVAFAVAIVGETFAIQFLKRRLLRAEARQRRMAERDPLTGVLNRRSFDAALRDTLASLPQRQELAADGGADGDGRAALVLFDFNDFKLINDLHGHPVGDDVLSAVARAGERVVRDGDCLARIGGDEFALVAPGAGHEGVLRLVDALEKAIHEADVPGSVEPVRATFGWAVAPDDGEEPEVLLLRADERLLQRKRLALSSSSR